MDWNDAYKEVIGLDAPWESQGPSPFLIRLLAEGYVKSGKALDVGCGFGTNSIFLAQKGFTVVGIDLATKATRLAAERAKQGNAAVEFRAVDFFEYQNPELFDFVFDRGFFHVLEQNQREAYFKKVSSLLKSSGLLSLEAFSEDNDRADAFLHYFKLEELRLLFRDHFILILNDTTEHQEPGKNGKKRFLHALLLEKK